MAYVLTLVLGICLSVVGFVATRSGGAGAWVPWVDVLVGLGAIVFAIYKAERLDRIRYTNGPILYGITLYLLGVIGLIIPIHPWLIWTNFAMGSAFLLVG